MRHRSITKAGLGFAVLLAASSLGAGRAAAHCDGLDGPVVGAARQALESGNVNKVLVWVKAESEPEIRQAFEETRAVRALGPGARVLADRYFYETLVRVHRAGEGAPYTGLKPAGRDLGPGIPAADRAVETGEIEPVAELLTDAVVKELTERFHAVERTRSYAVDDVAAGRAHIEAYVGFIHYVEGLSERASAGAEHGTDAHRAGHTAD